MATITLSQTTSPNYTHGGNAATLKIFAHRTFRASDGSTVFGGNPESGVYAKSVACTVSGTTLTIPEFTLLSTTDAIDYETAYTAWLYDSNGEKVELFLTNFAVPHNITSTTWANIINYNLAPKIKRRNQGVYSADQVDALLAQWELGDLADVALSNVTRNDFLRYSTPQWVNSSSPLFLLNSLTHDFSATSFIDIFYNGGEQDCYIDKVVVFTPSDISGIYTGQSLSITDGQVNWIDTTTDDTLATLDAPNRAFVFNFGTDTDTKFTDFFILPAGEALSMEVTGTFPETEIPDIFILVFGTTFAPIS